MKQPTNLPPGSPHAVPHIAANQPGYTGSNCPLSDDEWQLLADYKRMSNAHKRAFFRLGMRLLNRTD